MKDTTDPTQASMGTLVGSVLRAIERSLDGPRLQEELGALLVGARAPSTGPSAVVLERIVLCDILDEGIVNARAEDRSYPLRCFFSELGELVSRVGAGDGALESDAFALASGLNFFFRSPMDPETRWRAGVEVSRQFYRLASAAGGIEADTAGRAAPLLANLMSQELERMRLECVDHARIFDSELHERTASSDPSSSRIVRAASFLCRVTTNNVVKMKAQVVT